MSSTDQKYYLKTSYIKFSVGHKLDCAMTLGLRVPNDIYQLWLEQHCGFHWGQGFLIYLLSWWSTWVRVRHLLQRPVVSWITTKNCNWLVLPGLIFQVSLSFSGLFWSNLSSFSAFYILLPIAQRWSRRLFISNHKLGRCSLKNSSWPNTYVAYKHFIFFKFDSDSWFTSVLLVLTKSVYKKGEGGVTQKSFKDQKKKASWETDVNNGPGNRRSKLGSWAPVCFYTHPGLAIKQSHLGGWGGDARKCWKCLCPILRIPCHYPHARERRQVQQCLPGKGTSCTKTLTSVTGSHLVKHRLCVYRQTFSLAVTAP